MSSLVAPGIIPGIVADRNSLLWTGVRFAHKDEKCREVLGRTLMKAWQAD